MNFTTHAVLATLLVYACPTSSAQTLTPQHRADFDGDGFDDLLLELPSGGARLLLGRANGLLDDATVRVGLGALTGSRSVAAADFGGDGRLDLAAVLANGALVLLRNDGSGGWESVAPQLGLELVSGVQRVEWGHFDAGDTPDLLVESATGVMLFKNELEHGFAPLLASPLVTSEPGVTLEATTAPVMTPSNASPSRGTEPAASANPIGRREVVSFATHDATRDRSDPTSAAARMLIGPVCVPSIIDATTGACLEADSIPTLGRLFPLSTDFNLDGSGNVGIGTTTPSAKLTVQGKLARQISRATGLGPGDPTDNGRLVSRTLNFTKLDASTSVRVSYTDNFNVYGAASSQGRWEIRVDGAAVSASPAYFDFFLGSSTLVLHQAATLVAYLDGLSAGAHTIEIWVGDVAGYGTADRYTGWNASRWTIEAEEVF